jgi:hypothetical protein
MDPISFFYNIFANLWILSVSFIIYLQIYGSYRFLLKYICKFMDPICFFYNMFADLRLLSVYFIILLYVYRPSPDFGCVHSLPELCDGVYCARRSVLAAPPSRFSICSR